MTGGVVAALAIGEVAARVTATPPPAVTTAAVTQAARTTTLPELPYFYLVKPNMHGTVKGKFYRTNSAGFRGREYAETSAPGVRRIVVIDEYDPHPNAAGHELFARALLDGVRTLPDTCWH